MLFRPILPAVGPWARTHLTALVVSPGLGVRFVMADEAQRWGKGKVMTGEWQMQRRMPGAQNSCF